MILRIPMSDRFFSCRSGGTSGRMSRRGSGLVFQLDPGAGHRKNRDAVGDGLPLLSFRTSSRIEERHESVLSLRTGRTRTIKNGFLRSIPQYELAFER
jgi:hypothetical protein